MVFLTTACIDSWHAFEIFPGLHGSAWIDEVSQTYWFPTRSYIQARGRYVKCIMSNCNDNYRLAMITPLVHQRRGLIIQGYDVGFTEQQEIITISVLLLCLLEQEHFVSLLGWGLCSYHVPQFAFSLSPMPQSLRIKLILSRQLEKLAQLNTTHATRHNSHEPRTL